MAWTILKIHIILLLAGQLQGQCVTKFCKPNPDQRNIITFKTIEENLYDHTTLTALCQSMIKANQLYIDLIKDVSINLNQTFCFWPLHKIKDQIQL